MPAADPPFPDPDTRHILEPDCSRCPALADARSCISWGQGDLDAELAVVGEAPGHGAPDAEQWQGGNHTGMAFTTRHSGRLVRSLVADLGYPVDECYFTNAVKCLPPDGDGGTRPPTDTERENCSTHLLAELEQVAPRVVLSAGKTATTSLLALDDRSLDGFLDHVATPIHSSTLDTTIVPILHPSYEAVWRARLGYEDRDAYAAALRETLARL